MIKYLKGENMDKEIKNMNTNLNDAEQKDLISDDSDNLKKLFVSVKNTTFAKVKFKEFGGRWDYYNKSWYMFEGLIPSVYSIISQLLAFDADLYCSELFIIKKKIKCWKCNKEMEVYAFATNKSYSKYHHYRQNLNLRLIPYITWLPRELYSYVRKNTNLALRDPKSHIKKFHKQKFWTNVCPHCKAIQSEKHLFFEDSKDAFWAGILYKDAPTLYATRLISKYVLSFGLYVPLADSSDVSIQKYDIVYPQTKVDILEVNLLKQSWKRENDIDLNR